MNDDIKEILHEMKQMCDVWVKVDGNMKSYNQDQIHKIYEYITNLQQKVKHYEETQTFGDYVKEVNLLVDYKTRIEKADWWLREMLKQAKSNETKAIISGALELLLSDRSDE